MSRHSFVPLLVAAVVMCVAVSGASAQSQTCDDTSGARNATEIALCVSHIKNAPFKSDRAVALQQCIALSHRGFTSDQLVEILPLFTFSDEQTAALTELEPYILGMYCKDVVTVLATFSFSSDQLSALTAVVNASAILDTADNQTIIDSFDFSSDQATAKEILSHMIPRSCTFGRVTQKNVVFVVDTSGSMSTTFTLDGQQYTRLSYVAEQLDLVIREQLQPYQNLNVLRFSSGVSKWQPGLVPVNPTNVDSAVEYIRSWSASGGTNMYDAITTAYADPDVVAIYLLSDGVPSVGVTSVSAIIAKAAELSKDKTIPIYTTAFLMGSDGGDDPALSHQIMSGLADATGGVYRAIEQSS